MSDKLCIELQSGRNLNNQPFINTFCSIRVGSAIVRTHTELKTCNPTYGVTHVFDIDNPTDTIHIKCYSTGAVFKTLLGSITIPICDHIYVLFDLAKPHAFTLYNTKHESVGELILRIGCLVHRETLDTTDFHDDLTTKQIYEMGAKIVEEDVKSIDRCLHALTNMTHLASYTNASLISQGEQITRTRSNIEVTAHNYNLANRKVRSIESIWGTGSNKITQPFVNTEPRTVKKTNETPMNVLTHRRCYSDVGESAGSYYSDLYNDIADPEQRCNLLLSQVDRNLDHMVPLVTQLKSDAIEMGQIINSQLKPLDKLCVEAAIVGVKVDKINHRMEQL